MRVPDVLHQRWAGCLDTGARRAIAAALRRPARLLAVPPALFRMFGRIGDLFAPWLSVRSTSASVRRLLDSLQVDIGHARAELDYSPRFTLAEGLARARRGTAVARSASASGIRRRNVHDAGTNRRGMLPVPARNLALSLREQWRLKQAPASGCDPGTLARRDLAWLRQALSDPRLHADGPRWPRKWKDSRSRPPREE